jgi:hypothetical protein
LLVYQRKNDVKPQETDSGRMLAVGAVGGAVPTVSLVENTYYVTHAISPET